MPSYGSVSSNTSRIYWNWYRMYYDAVEQEMHRLHKDPCEDNIDNWELERCKIGLNIFSGRHLTQMGHWGIRHRILKRLAQIQDNAKV